MTVGGAVLVAFLGGASGLRRKNREGRKASTCGIKGSDSDALVQIVNGDDAAPCEWPWHATLNQPGASGTSGAGHFFCGGTLIDSEWVLTAARCVEEYAGVTGLEVTLAGRTPYPGNEDESNTKRQDIPASQVFLHPKFKHPYERFANATHDLALIRLEWPVEVNSCVRPACLPTGDDVEPGTSCWTTGWGKDKAGEDGLTALNLQEAEVETWSYDECTGFLNYPKDMVDDSMVCAQGGNVFSGIRDRCSFDSGGPLVCESVRGWTVYGITSWGRGCGARRFPGVWARVHSEMDWIESTIASAPAEAPKQPRCNDGFKSYLPTKSGECQCAFPSYCLEGCKPSEFTFCDGNWSQYSYKLGTCETCQCYTEEEIRACAKL